MTEGSVVVLADGKIGTIIFVIDRETICVLTPDGILWWGNKKETYLYQPVDEENSASHDENAQ